MDDDDENGGEDVQSILTYGAQALFDSENTRDITCKIIFSRFMFMVVHAQQIRTTTLINFSKRRRKKL